MYRLLIVEDEKWEREGLRDFLEWSRLGIEVSGCACNGVEGVKLAEKYRPDIILTDIRMPVMDGIQLSKNVRDFLPDAKIIIISGYDDFQYAKQSFAFQAFDYILKPIEKKAFQEVIFRVLRELDQEKSRKKEKEALKSQWMNYVRENRENLLLDILECDTDLAYVSEIVSTEEIKLQDRLVILILSFRSSIDDCSQEFLNAMGIILNEKGIVFSLNKQLKEAILCMRAPASQSELKTALMQLRNTLKKKLDIEVIIGVGDTAEGFSEISQSYSQAKDAISYRFLADCGELLFYHEIEEIGCMGLDLARPIVLKGYDIIKKIAYNTQKDRMEVCSPLVDNFLSTLKEIRSLSKVMLNKFFTEAMIGLNSVSNNTCKNLNECVWDKNKFETDFSKLDSISQTRQYLMDFIRTIESYTINRTSSNYAEVVQKVIEIIEKRYSDDLDLECISKEIHLTPYYIGSIFKKNTGKQFNQYLNEYRIDKAKEMLQTDKIKVSQLGDEVGIRNPSYFCSLFKSRFGISPGDYKDILKGRQENV